LRDRNVTFKQLVNETRYRQAMMYLEESKLTLTEIAFVLGYSELSAFNHAFKSWTGLTPRKYRQSALER
jgi:AraC-like DNA-binding protein